MGPIFSITCLDRVNIWNRKAGLTEPSGLALHPDGESFWTVSDDTGRLFRMGLDGALLSEGSFALPCNDLEGVTAEPAGRFLFAVAEESGEIIKVEISREEIIRRRRPADLEGFGRIARHFETGTPNSCLEGITWNSRTSSLFLLREGPPGLLIELAPDLNAIRTHTILDADNGFVDPGSNGAKVDVSGLCHDPSRNAFWIVSDEARRLYLYDPDREHVRHSAPLGYARNGRYREIKKAEGIAFDPRSGRLYVVSDEEARLYIFDVRA